MTAEPRKGAMPMVWSAEEERQIHTLAARVAQETAECVARKLANGTKISVKDSRLGILSKWAIFVIGLGVAAIVYMYQTDKAGVMERYREARDATEANRATLAILHNRSEYAVFTADAARDATAQQGAQLREVAKSLQAIEISLTEQAGAFRALKAELSNQP